jgi:hypothetical protein
MTSRLLFVCYLAGLALAACAPASREPMRLVPVPVAPAPLHVEAPIMWPSAPGAARRTSFDSPSPNDCGDTQTDSYHCGRCNRSCFGGPCVAGQCQLANGGFIVAEGDWGVSGGSAGVFSYRLDSYLLRSGTREVFAELSRVDPERGVFPTDLAIKDGIVYWSSLDGISRCPVQGCPDGEDELVAFDYDPTQRSDGDSVGRVPFTVDGGELTFARGDQDDSFAQLWRCPIDDCDAPTIIFEDAASGPLRSLTNDGTWLVFEANDSLHACRSNDCQATRVTLDTQLGIASQYWVGDRWQQTTEPVVHGLEQGRVVWANFPDGIEPPFGPFRDTELRTCVLPDCASPTTLMRVQRPAGLAVHGGILWLLKLDEGPWGIKCTLPTCDDVEPLTIAPADYRLSSLTTIVVTPDYLSIGGQVVVR